MQDYEFKVFQELLKVLAGITIKDDQKLMVETRVQRRMMEIGMDGYGKYIKYVQEKPSKEIPYLISILTTHTTHFFREKEHFNYLENKFLPELMNKDSRRYIQMWSAACSSGEEVYSLALTVLEFLRKNNLPKMIKVIGSDIDVKMIQIAKEGVYRVDQIKEIEPLLQRRYFSLGTGEISDYVKVKNTVKEVVEFHRKNLFAPPYFREQRQFDVIFIRNVFIYFDKKTIKDIISELTKNLTADGILVLGHTENIIDIVSPFKLLYNSIYTFKKQVDPDMLSAKEFAGESDINKKEKIADKKGSPSLTSIPPVPPAATLTASASVSASDDLAAQFNAEIRVLIVDDSPTVRMMLRRVLSAEHKFIIAGEAQNPIYAEKILEKTKDIDVITLDINMDQKDGITYLEELSKKKEGHPPVVMISSISQDDAIGTLRAFELGAFDYIEKPDANRLPDLSDHIRTIVREAAFSGKKKKRDDSYLAASATASVSASASANANATLASKGSLVRGEKFEIGKNKSGLAFVKSSFTVQSENISKEVNFDSTIIDNSIILIGASTGGVVAIKEILEVFPQSTPPILIVQHIPATFSKVFADRLGDVCKVKVREAEDGEELKNSIAYVAPGGKQLKLIEKGSSYGLNVNNDSPVNKHKPSVDYLFQSVAAVKERNKVKFNKKIIAVILTGMGADGAKGMLVLKNMGAITIAQDEYSSVVYGMPKVAKEIGAAMEIAKLSEIPALICQHLRK
ncbi:MAG: chemotaxis-specific protein-glutamate methyltransferase CheB [Oligoflexia bacterium]|nr:chemotaxis-specific protein-glutamate methyltransferase CheB [Oligoflexia bacterium]